MRNYIISEDVKNDVISLLRHLGNYMVANEYNSKVIPTMKLISESKLQKEDK